MKVFWSQIERRIDYSFSFGQIVEFCEELYRSGERSPYLLSFILDLYQERCIRGNTEDNVAELDVKINEICNGMITTHDTIRAKYWQYVLNKFKLDMERVKQTARESSSASDSTATSA